MISRLFPTAAGLFGALALMVAAAPAVAQGLQPLQPFQPFQPDQTLQPLQPDQPLQPGQQQAPADNGTVSQSPPPPTDRITNPVAVFAGLDKITGRIISFDVYVDETVQFGALQVTPRVCYSRPLTEEPQTDAFVEVDEITLARKIQRIFTGWMFAASPGLHAVDNAVYDVWLTDCKMTSEVPPPAKR